MPAYGAAMPDLTVNTSTRPRLLLVTLCYVSALAGAVQSVVLPLLPDIAAQLDVSRAAASWVITVGLIAAAVAAPVLGRTADLRGGGRVLIWCAVALLLGGLLSAAATSLPLLLLGRTLQGLSGAVFPLAVTVLRTELPVGRRVRDTALVSAALGVGGGLGPVIAGLLSRDVDDFRAVFAVLAVACAVAVLALIVVLPRGSARREPGRIDPVGTLLLAACLVLVMLPLSQGSAWGWASPGVIGSGLGAVLFGVLFVRRSRRRPGPVVDIALLTHRPVLVTHLLAALVGGIMYAFFLGIYDFVQTPPSAGYGFGASALDAALIYLLPSTVASVLAAPVGSRLVARFGGRVGVGVAGLVGVAGFGILGTVPERQWLVVLASTALGTSISLAYAALPALLAQAVALRQTGEANSVNALSRWVGGAAASSAVSAVLAGSGAAPPAEAALVLVFAGGALAGALMVVLARFGLPPADRPVPVGEPESASSLAGRV